MVQAAPCARMAVLPASGVICAHRDRSQSIARKEEVAMPEVELVSEDIEHEVGNEDSGASDDVEELLIEEVSIDGMCGVY